MATMEFRLLGPVEVRTRDGNLPLGGVNPRTLLAVLLLDAPRVVGIQRLVDAIWGAGPPATASTQIHGYVSALRKRFADVDPDRAVIVTEPGGYRVAPRPGELDLRRFDDRVTEAGHALSEGRITDCADSLREALALWQGTALGGVAETLAASRERLEERRLAAVESRMDADLQLGRHDDLIPELRDVVAAHPFREGPRGQLMLALYRGGRTADALGAFREGRRLLAEELGIDPGTELQRLEQAILTADPSLDLPRDPAADTVGTARPAQLPPDIQDFTGRDEQVAQACAILGVEPGDDPDAPTAVGVTVVAGRAGVGKTSLAVHVAHRVRAGFADGQLYAGLQGAHPRPADPAEVLGRFLRALGVEPSRVPESLEERSQLYRTRLAGHRVLVVLDDAADEAQVRPLLPGEPGCAVLVTSRSRLSGLEGTQLVDLEILDPDAAFELLDRVVGADRLHDDRPAGEEIVRLCGYLPLAVRIAGAKLADRPHWTPRKLADRLADERHRLDELAIGDLEVRANVALSYAGLTPAEQVAFRRLGLLDAPDFAAWALAALADVGRSEAEDLADRLVAARLLDVVRVDDGVRYRFHDLLRLYARELAESEESPPERTAARRRGVEGWLHAAEDAATRTSSAAFGETAAPVPGWRPDQAELEELQRDPLAWYESEWPALAAAIDQAGECGWPDLVFGLAIRVAPYVVVRGHYDAWRHIAERTRSVAHAAGAAHEEAVGLRWLGELTYLQYRLHEAREHFAGADALFTRLGDRHGVALVGCGWGAVEAELGEVDAARARLEGAAEVLRGTDDVRTLAWTLLRLGTLARLEERYDEAADQMDAALDVLGGGGTSVDEAAIVERLGMVRTRQGRTAEARELLSRALELRRSHRDRFGEANSLRGLGEALRVGGEPEHALDCLTRALRLWRELDFTHEQATTLRLIGDVHADTGDDAGAAAARARASRLDESAGCTPPGSGPTADP